MAQKTLPTLKIRNNNFEEMELALQKLNKEQMVESSMQDFRRLCYINLSKMILRGDPLPFKLER